MDALTTGKREVQMKPVSLDEALAQIDLVFAKRLAEKRITLRVVKPPDTVLVWADSRSFQYTVLNNLVSNAVKFSEPGAEIVLTILPQGDKVTISVADRGVGIPAKVLAGLFDPFKPTSRRGTAGEKGTGFGMPIVKSYIDLYKGAINVVSQTAEDSKDAHGTTITVTLRKAPAAKKLKAG